MSAFGPKSDCRTTTTKVLEECEESCSAALENLGDACSTGAGGGQAEGGAGGASGSAQCEAAVIPCEDNLVLGLNLQPKATDGKVTNTQDGNAFVSEVDATAGGAFAATPESFTYVRVTDSGFEKVDISDEESLTSLDWDLAFRRYVIRINSGDGGPGCVEATRLPGTPAFEDVTEIDSKWKFMKESFFTESCDLVPDGSGLEGSPATALASYWTYPGCVKMTGHIFAVKLADSKVIKLEVLRFYNEDVQAQCDSEGTIPNASTGSGNFVVRWAPLP